MLTNDDIKKIGQVVDENLDKRFAVFEKKNYKTFSDLEIKTDIRFEELGSKFNKQLTTTFEKELKPIKKELSYIRKSLELAIGKLDEADVKLDKRVTRIEDHLKLPDAN